MSTQRAFRFRNPALLIALAAVYPVLAYSAGAGSVDFSSGSVTAVNMAGVQRPLTKGAEISNGDTIRTGDGGRAQVRFTDGAMISLQPQTEFRIDNYQYANKSDAQEKGFFSLLKGGMRTITGLIGRSNRDNYKVSTSVATIGIRGTEYTASLGDSGSELVLNTGEGLIEVCNAAGCMLLASGESGVVSGGGTPRRTDSRPQLPPSQPSKTSVADFSTSDQRAPDGSISPVTPTLSSGSGYMMSWSGQQGGSVANGITSTGTASFGSVSNLQQFSDANDTFTVGSSAGSFSIDGVIGWGRWSAGTRTDGSGSSFALSGVHYVVGVPSANLGALGGLVATYQLAGFTVPTSSTGLIGGAPSGSFTVTFQGGAGTSSALLNLSVPIGGTTQSFSDEFLTVQNTSGTFGNGSTVKGFFAGANASHAGLTYQISAGGAVGDVSGAAAFKR